MSKREELNSQVKLGRAAGVGGTNIGRIRRGEVSPTVETIAAIAHAFDLQAADLLREDLFDSEGTLRPLARQTKQTERTATVPPAALVLMEKLSATPLSDASYKALDSMFTLAESTIRKK